MNYINDFNTRLDLKNNYGSNAHLLYALQLRYDISDIVAIASESLTDGGDDKKCDLIYIDTDTGIAIIAQAYMKKNPKVGDLAPGNKASDLNTACAWALSTKIESVPERIRSQINSLRDAIIDERISTVYFWYVHNLNESNNPEVKKELLTMQTNAKASVKELFKKTNLEVNAIEVGNELIERWFNSSTEQITIVDEIAVETKGMGYEINGQNWRSFVTVISAKWLKSQHQKFGDDLFSGNPRTFLGSGKKKNKINLGIIETIESEPDNFWTYNNGITALVNNYDPDGINEKNELAINGISIINGAQTTGAIANAASFEDAWVQIRFIVCKNEKIIEEIISNNNKQNEILPSDLRSNDRIQNKLRIDFEQFNNIFYNGGRRGNIRPSRSKEIFDPYLVAQTLRAFHGDCITAYNAKTELWSDDALYTSIFCEQLTPEHIIFTYSLARAIDVYKLNLQKTGDSRRETENNQLNFLKQRGSKMLLIYAISRCMETVLGKKIVDSWKLSFKDSSNFEGLVSMWQDVIKVPMSLSPHLTPALNNGLNNKELVVDTVNKMVALLSAIEETLQQQSNTFCKKLSKL